MFMHDNSSQRSVTTKVIIVNYCKSYWMLCVCSNFSTMLQSLNRASSANYTLFGACSNACAVERLLVFWFVIFHSLRAFACTLSSNAVSGNLCLTQRDDFEMLSCDGKNEVDLFIVIPVNSPPFGESYFRVNHSLPLCEGWKTWENQGQIRDFFQW